MRGHSLFLCAMGLLLAAGCTANGAALTPGDSQPLPAGVIMKDKLDIGQDARIGMTHKAMLYGSEKESTITLVQLPQRSNGDYAGYLGIWDAEGNLLEKHELEGYSLLHPQQLLAEDITGDGIADILLETDEQVNGGMGAHRLQVWAGGKEQYREIELQDQAPFTLQAQFQPDTGGFQITSQPDERRWEVKLPADQLEAQERELATGSHEVNIDPFFAAAVDDGMLVTRRWLWIGRLQLNGVGVLVTEYRYQDGKLAVADYRLEPGEGYPALTETTTE